MNTLISSVLGTIFGTFNTSGFASNTSIFDENYVNNNPNFGAYMLGTTGYIGKQFNTPTRIGKAHVYGWNDRGIVDDGNSGTVYLYGSNTQPQTDSDGVVLGQVTFTEPAGVAYGSPVIIDSTDRNTGFTYVWIKVVGNSTGVCCSEVEFYEATEDLSQQYSRPLAIFIGAGQSNMKGDAPIPDQSVYSNRNRLKMFSLSGTIRPAVDPLMDYTDTLWPQFTNDSIGCGPLISFGSTLVADFKNFDVLLVNSSKGSTSIHAWVRGQPLYDGLIARANAALLAAPTGSFIAGFLWQQGESDTYTEALCAEWMYKFSTLVSNVRTDLSLPSLPTVIIGLGPYDGFAPAWSQLRFAQQYMKLPDNTRYVKTFDLPNELNADWLYTDSVLEIGRRSALEMKNLLPVIL